MWRFMGSNPLFDDTGPRPLAEILRPDTLSDVVGQGHLLDAGKPLGRMVADKRLSSIIFWGPPGCGKTTIARLLADAVGLRFVSISAIFSGVADLKAVFKEAESHHAQGSQTLLFVDEIHRFNKAQQDSFLPFVEKGVVVLVGATTENPSFELNNALLSRCQVLTLKPLTDEALENLLVRAEAHFEKPLPLTPEARSLMVSMAEGDGRHLLMMAESLPWNEGELTLENLKNILVQRAALYDKDGEQHYNLISAFHKSLRGSDGDGALYWLTRMLEGGEDPRYVARRLIRFASEDVGLADPQALIQALAAADAYERLGSPEGELAIVQAVLYVATAPKSNGIYKAYKMARAVAQKTGHLAPPKHILNAPTKLMKEEGYGQGYAYDHDQKDGFSGQNYFPEDLPRQRFYTPVERGFEREILKRLEYWEKLRAKKQNPS